MNSLTKDERRAVARRIFEALCAQYPDRYIALVEQPGRAEPDVPADTEPGEIQTSPAHLIV
jgi:hypothetical protein